MKNELAQYRTPTCPYIGRGEETKNLYAAEEKRDAACRKAAESLGRVLGYNEKQFWTHTLPEALLSILGHWDQRASYVAAKAFVARYEATHPEETQACKHCGRTDCYESCVPSSATAPSASQPTA